MTDTIRAGDRFLIEVEVIRFAQGYWRVGAKYNDADPWHLDLPFGVLLAGKRLPRTIRVGDRVRSDHFRDTVTVIAIDGSDAWVRVAGGEALTFDLADLTFADEASS